MGHISRKSQLLITVPIDCELECIKRHSGWRGKDIFARGLIPSGTDAALREGNLTEAQDGKKKRAQAQHGALFVLVAKKNSDNKNCPTLRPPEPKKEFMMRTQERIESRRNLCVVRAQKIFPQRICSTDTQSQKKNIHTFFTNRARP